MAAHAEPRGESGAVHRRPKQRLANALALLIEEVDFAVRRLEPEEAVRLGADGQRGVAKLSVMSDAAVRVLEPFEQQVEPVAGMNVALEVDVVAEQANEIDHHAGRHTFARAVFEQAVADGAARPGNLKVELLFVLERLEGAGDSTADDRFAVVALGDPHSD